MRTVVWNSILDQYFTAETMSLHMKADRPILTKIWRPGDRRPVTDPSIIITKEDLKILIEKLFKEVENRNDGFLEIDRSLSKVLQIGPYRIVIVHPPLSDGLEMTVVKPTKVLDIEDYNLAHEILELLKNKSKWILISWAPWSGKTTFAQALVGVYQLQNKIIKTLESPRDLQVSDDVVQYSFTYWTHDEVRDVLLLSRPDFTIYDEVRNKPDFELFKDLRLTWIGLVWVIHATRPVDSIQRFLWTIEMWVIPQVLDTVIYIDKGQIWEILQLELTVKVPAWMQSEDLARPVIIITSFMTKKPVYEIYTFWEQIVVMPVSWEGNGGKWLKGEREKGINEFAKQWINQKLKQTLRCDFVVKISPSGRDIDLYVPESYRPNVIWRAGKNIMELEKTLWLKIHVESFDELPLLWADIKLDKWWRKWSQMIVEFPVEFAWRKVCLLSADTLNYFDVDMTGTVIIKDKNLIKDFDKRGFVVVDTDNL